MGSILGPQQQFLLDMQNDMFQAGAAMRRPPAPPASVGTDAERSISQQVERLSLRERSQAEQYEDAGQGERLRNAKRGVRGTPPPGVPPEVVLPPVVRHSGGPRDSSVTTPDLARGVKVTKPQAQEQRPVVSMIRRSLRGVFGR